LLAAAATALALPATGCLDGREPPGNCAVANRPGPAVGEPYASPGISRYPTGPPPVSDREAAIDYADAYERAYRDHADGDAGPITIETTGRRTYRSPPESVLYRRRYRYEYHQYDQDVATVVKGTTRATYYLGADRVFRAAAEGPGLPYELDPNPWERGQTLQCFEER
jgi:hypothetical protein